MESSEHVEARYLLDGDEALEGFEPLGADADLGLGETRPLFRWTGEGDPPTGAKWAGGTA